MLFKTNLIENGFSNLVQLIFYVEIVAISRIYAYVFVEMFIFFSATVRQSFHT